MADRKQMLATIRAAYAARVRGDVDDMLRAFTDDAVFRLNAAPLNQVTAVHTIDSRELRVALQHLIENFEFRDFEIVESIMEGERVAVRSMFTVRAKRTGKVAQMEVFDLVEFKDGKISSFIQYFDTASANNLMMSRPADSAAVTA